MLSTTLHEVFRADILGRIGIFWGVYYLVSGCFLVLDMAQPKGYRSRAVTKDRFPATTQVLKSIAPTLVQNTILATIFSWTVLGLAFWYLPRQEMPFDRGWIIQFLQTMPIHVFGVEVWFYNVHRFVLHSPALYGLLHKKHHEFIQPIAIAAIYCGATEMIILNTCSLVLVPAFVTQLDLNMMTLFTCLGAVNATLSHSGHYVLPKLLYDTAFHDLHHMQFNKNFGVFKIGDKCLGTGSSLK